MASLQEIKTRMNSIDATKKITKAMELVASSKLKRAQKNLNSIKEYYLSVQEIFDDLLSKANSLDDIFPKTNSNKTLYILITSDMGLCGGYNSNIIKLGKKYIQENDDVIVLGTKGVASSSHLNWNIKLAIPRLGDNPNYVAAQKVSKEAMASFLSGNIKSIKLIHTEFINSVTYNPKITTLLPLSKENVKKKKNNTFADFEPSVNAVIRGSLPLYFSAMLFGTTTESKVSEMSSRRIAMENATDNAEEIIEKLDLQYNRARQASITQEINEIVAGSTSE